METKEFIELFDLLDDDFWRTIHDRIFDALIVGGFRPRSIEKLPGGMHIWTVVMARRCGGSLAEALRVGRDIRCLLNDADIPVDRASFRFRPECRRMTIEFVYTSGYPGRVEYCLRGRSRARRYIFCPIIESL